MLQIEDLRKNEEFYKFVAWVALPTGERQPGTRDLLAKELGIEPSTLSSWKKVEGFWGEVDKIRGDYFKERFSNVLLGVYLNAVKEGSPTAAKFLAQYIMGWTEKTALEFEDKTDRLLNEVEIEEIIKILKRGGITITREQIDRQESKKGNPKEQL